MLILITELIKMVLFTPIGNDILKTILFFHVILKKVGKIRPAIEPIDLAGFNYSEMIRQGCSHDKSGYI